MLACCGKEMCRLSREVIEMATIAGARAAHLDHKIGTVTPGKEADIIMLATDRINVFRVNNVPGTIVTLMDTSNVENVFVAGKVVKWHGTLVGVDLSRGSPHDRKVARHGSGPGRLFSRPVWHLLLVLSESAGDT